MNKTSAQLNLRMQGEQLHTQIGLCLELHDSLERDKTLLSKKLSPEEREQVFETKRQADKFVDSIIQSLNEDYDEKDVTLSMPKREKYECVRKLHKELDAEFQDFSQL